MRDIINLIGILMIVCLMSIAAYYSNYNEKKRFVEAAHHLAFTAYEYGYEAATNGVNRDDADAFIENILFDE